MYLTYHHWQKVNFPATIEFMLTSVTLHALYHNTCIPILCQLLSTVVFTDMYMYMYLKCYLPCCLVYRLAY